MDASRLLVDMVDQIGKRWDGAAKILGSIPEEFGDPAPVLASARDFIGSGGLGYARITGRKPR